MVPEPAPSHSLSPTTYALDETDAQTGPENEVRQVFRDEGNRWRRVRASAAIVACVFCVLATLFILSLRRERRSNPGDPAWAFAPEDVRRRASEAFGANVPAPPVDAETVIAAEPERNASASSLSFHAMGIVEDGDPEALATQALASLGAHARMMTDVVATGVRLTADGKLAGRVADVTRSAVAKANLPLWEIIGIGDAPASGAPGAAGVEVTALAKDPNSSRALIDAISQRLTEDHANGVLLELGEDDVGDPTGDWRRDLLSAASARLARDGRSTGLVVGASFSPAVLASEASATSLVLLRAHLDATSLAPGAVVPRRWLAGVLDAAARVVDSSKIVLGVATESAGWPIDSATLAPRGLPQSLSWSDVMARAGTAGVRPSWDDATGNLTIALPGRDGIGSLDVARAGDSDDRTTALFTYAVDGATFADDVAIARAFNLSGVAVDAMGGEDPRVWRVLDARGGVLGQDALTTLPRPEEWQLVGSGVEMRVDSVERDGIASITRGENGLVASERYDVLPSSTMVVRRAPVPADSVALTFDDGPSAEFTPSILEILSRHHAHATFFLIGTRMEREPEIVRRIIAEGHEVGNHSFSHADLGTTEDRSADLEVRATNLLFEATVGRTTLLFRPPYRCSDAPADPEDAASIRAGARNGMMTIGSTIDPRDWERPLATNIVERVMTQVRRDRGGVVLLHDGGGDRSATVVALDEILDALEKERLKIVQVHDLLGTNIEGVNPTVATKIEQRASQLVWWSGTWGLRALQVVAMFALVMGSMRFLTLIVFASLELRSRRHAREAVRRAEAELNGEPIASVTVVIPAYNEGRVIERTIASVLASVSVALEVIVLDDGSTDDTAERVEAAFGADPRVRLMRLTNGGKARALNIGFANASHDIVVALDADTLFLPETICELAVPFEDPAVAAVAGRAVVGNAAARIARWQALEYVVGQAIERRAWRYVGVVSVVPGAVGAWRRDAVLRAGGFGRDTLAEDCDLTIALQVAGYRVDYAARAVALTEAPESYAALIKQRFRWSFGVLQTVWKQRAVLAHPGKCLKGNHALGLLLLPTVLSSHIATPLLAPVADLAALVAMYLGYTHAIIPYVIALFAFEAALTLFAVIVDRADVRLLRDWPIQRAAYRWLLFYALGRAVIAALRGSAVGWGKLVRTGTVAWPGAEQATQGASTMKRISKIDACIATLVIATGVSFALGCAGAPGPESRPAALPEAGGQDATEESKTASDPDPDALLDAAGKALEAKDFDLAESLARRTIEASPHGYGYAYVVLGDVQMERHAPEKALALYQRAVAEDADDEWAFVRSTQALEALGKKKDARTRLRAWAKSHARASSDVLDALGWAELERGGSVAAAESAFRRAQGATKDDAEAWYGLAVIAALRNDANAVGRDLTRAIAIDPSRRSEATRDDAFADIRDQIAVRKALRANR